MTNPNHTDTSRSGDLVERLRSFRLDDSDDYDAPVEAADRIEALEAENERLRDDSWFDQFEEQEQLRDNAEQRLSVVEAENERLREAMRDAITEIETGAPLTGNDILSAALGEKQ